MIALVDAEQAAVKLGSVDVNAAGGVCVTEDCRGTGGGCYGTLCIR